MENFKNEETFSKNLTKIVKSEVFIIKNGPIKISGLPVMIVHNGTVVESKNCYLCRCGASNRKPYCDGTHEKIEFED